MIKPAHILTIGLTATGALLASYAPRIARREAGAFKELAAAVLVVIAAVFLIKWLA